MAWYRIRYTSYVDVEADDEVKAREEACNPSSEQEILDNLQELEIEKI